MNYSITKVGYPNKGGEKLDLANNVDKYLQRELFKGRKVSEIIKIAEVGVGTLYEVKRGNQMPRVDTAAKLAKALNTTPEELFPCLKEVMK